MAFLQAQEDQQNQDPTYPKTAGTSPLIGQSGGDVGSNVSTAGIGKGGRGGWTNIQAYLGANANDTGSAQNLSQAVGNQFQTEQQNMQKGAQDFVSGARKQVDDARIDNTQADQLIKQAGQSYTYGSDQPQSYKDTVGKVQGALTGQYQGPREYNYALGAETQKYGEGLKNDGSFDQIMSDLYSKKANAPLSAGQYQLQKQFDVNNAALGDTRKRLVDEYGNLGKMRDDTVTNTTKELGGLEQTYRENQNALRDYLSGQANTYSSQIDKLEADARTQHAKDAAKSNGYNSSYARAYDAFNEGGLDFLKSFGFNGTGLGQEIVDIPRVSYSNTPTFIDPNLIRAQIESVNNFYKNEMDKYANTADAEERNWNAIQDFLGSTADKKQQGFKVWG